MWDVSRALKNLQLAFYPDVLVLRLYAKETFESIWGKRLYARMCKKVIASVNSFIIWNIMQSLKNDLHKALSTTQEKEYT